MRVASERRDAHQRRARDAALRRVRDLPQRDIIDVYEWTREYLQQAGVPISSADQELRERVEALNALRSAAAHLGLPPERAPTVREYDNARDKLGLELSARQIQYRWGMWREAGNALTGKRTSESPEQVALRRPTSPAKELQRGAGPTGELPLAALRAWLADTPGSPRSSADYDRWRRRVNKGRPEEDRYMALATIFQTLLLPWAVAVEVARPDAELDLATAQERYMQQLKHESGPLGLCNASAIALLHGEPAWQVQTWANEGKLPPSVAVLMGSRIWRWTDIEAHAVNKNLVFEHSEGELQEQVMDYDELVLVLQGDLPLKQIKARVSSALVTGRPTVPPHAGWFSPEGRYWLRKDVEQWVKEHPELVGASTDTLRHWNRGHRQRVAKRPNRPT